MIVGYAFPGDDNKDLKWVQHDAYGSVLDYWFRECRGRYLYAERLLAVRTPLGEQIETLKGFDHRSIQDAHDVLAAYFRRDIYTGQPNLFEPQQPLTSGFMLDQWWHFVRREIEALLDEPTVTRLFLEACVNEKEAIGAGANGALAIALRTRFNLPVMPRS